MEIATIFSDIYAVLIRPLLDGSLFGNMQLSPDNKRPSLRDLATPWSKPAMNVITSSDQMNALKTLMFEWMTQQLKCKIVGSKQYLKQAVVHPPESSQTNLKDLHPVCSIAWV